MSVHARYRTSILATAAAAALCAPLGAQAPARDTLRLSALQSAAVQRDPRQRELALLASQTQLRIKNIESQRLPVFSLEGQGQYQSDVVTIPIQLPDGQKPPLPPHDTYDLHVDAQQSLLDPTLASRRADTRAQLAASEAHVRTQFYALRQSVNDAYFSALLFGTQSAELTAAITDLEARLRAAEQRERAGSALPSEANMLRAELLRRRQDRAELDANRQAALVVLGDLTGRVVDTSAALEMPLENSTAGLAGGDTAPHSRPEYQEFAAMRDRLATQQAVIAAGEKPRLSAFARTGYGKPGLNMLSNTFDAYWLAGLRVQWAPWNWGSTAREREALQLQRDIVASDEAAFGEGLRRAVESDRTNVARLSAALDTDDQIVALREQVVHETGLRLDEGVVTAADYVARQSDALAARLARAAHRVQLSQARAHYLTTLGIEVR
jgi:outer membrane protein TolC